MMELRLNVPNCLVCMDNLGNQFNSLLSRQARNWGTTVRAQVPRAGFIIGAFPPSFSLLCVSICTSAISRASVISAWQSSPADSSATAN